MTTPTILITAYKNTEQLNYLIDFFSKDVNIYIHFDTKSKNLLPQIINRKNVFVYSEYSVNWGSFNHLRSILFLCDQALKKEENKYFHLISGEDYPCCPDYRTFQESINYNINYIEYFQMPYKNWSYDGGLDRINKYHLNDVLNIKNRKDFDIMLKFSEAQYSDNISSRKSFQDEFRLDLYGGSTWWSLNRDALEYILRFTKENKSFLYRFRYTFCSEEIYFQTILLNSKLKESIKNNNLRYIDWTSRNKGTVPSYLEENDFIKMVTSNKIFARKLEIDTILKYKSFVSSFYQ